MDGLGRFMAYIGSFKEEDGLVGGVDKRGQEVWTTTLTTTTRMVCGTIAGSP